MITQPPIFSLPCLLLFRDTLWNSFNCFTTEWSCVGYNRFWPFREFCRGQISYPTLLCIISKHDKFTNNGNLWICLFESIRTQLWACTPQQEHVATPLARFPWPNVLFICSSNLQTVHFVFLVDAIGKWTSGLLELSPAILRCPFPICRWLRRRGNSL